MDQLEQKLKIDERVIVALLIVHPQATSFIKEKLSSLQMEITQIPPHLGEKFYQEWNDKIAALWRQYATELNAQAASNGRVPRTKSIFDQDHTFQTPAYISANYVYPFETPNRAESSKGAKSIATDISVVSGLVSNDYKIPFSSTPTHSVPFVNKNFHSADTQLYPKSRESVHHEMLLQFERFSPVASSADHEAMQQLQFMVQKAREKTLHFWNDYYLQADLFDRAMSKLPEASRKLYLQLYDRQCRKRSLKDLLRFLKDESANHYYYQMDYSNERKRTAVRQEMNLTLDQLTGQLDASNVDMAELRKLHWAVANARQLLLNNLLLVKDNQLHTEMFDLAFPRLPTEWREQYRQIYSNPQRKSLRDLLAFLTDKLIDQFSQKFALLPTVAHVADIEPMKALLTTITQATTMFCPRLKGFNEQIFDLAYTKLSDSVCALYENNRDAIFPFKSLLKLRIFIANLMSDNMSPVGCPQMDRCFVCFVCSQSGHLSKNCPNLVCFRCQRIGHTKNDCIVAL